MTPFQQEPSAQAPWTRTMFARSLTAGDSFRSNRGTTLDANPNTVQLVSHDGCGGWSGWLWPGRVVGAFDVPSGHLAFDDARVRAWSSLGVQSAEQEVDGSSQQCFAVMVLRGESRPGGRWICG